MHLRAPSIDRGVQSFLWSVLFFVVIWFGGMALGVAGTSALVFAVVASFFIFVFVRTCGEDDPDA